MEKITKQFANWWRELIVGLVLILMLIIGVELRSAPGDFSMWTNNVSSYYFQRSNYLNENGNLPLKDIWGFAPDSASDNIPPFLALASVSIYKVLNIAGLWNSFYDFALVFPIIVFVLWALSGFWIFIDLFKSYFHGLAFVFILAIVPVSISLTQKGFYTEEALGAFLIFLSLYFLVKAVENKYFLIYLSLSLLFLALDWQQFPIFYACLVAYMVFYFLILPKMEKNKIFLFILAMALPLILGHVVSRDLMGIGYSPLSMIKEMAWGFINYNDGTIRIAMGRNDWQNLKWSSFVNNYGFLLGILIAVGVIKLALAKMEKAKRFIWIIFGLAAFAVAFMFLKSKYFALPIILFICLEGFDGILNLRKIDRSFYQNIKDWMKKRWQPAVSRLKNLKKKKTAAILVILCVFAGAMAVRLATRNVFSPKPEPEIIFKEPTGLKIGQTAQMEIGLKNNGGLSWDNGSSFSGLHIEIENARVDNIWIESEAPNGVVIKSDARRGNLFWFETKMPPLKAGQSAKVLFNLTPTTQRVSVYYRSWLPSYCSEEQQKAVLEDLRESWQSIEAGGWRNEACIERLPQNNSQEIVCPVLVYGAHKELQEFRCFKKEFLTE